MTTKSTRPENAHEVKKDHLQIFGQHNKNDHQEWNLKEKYLEKSRKKICIVSPYRDRSRNDKADIWREKK